MCDDGSQDALFEVVWLLVLEVIQNVKDSECLARPYNEDSDGDFVDGCIGRFRIKARYDVGSHDDYGHREENRVHDHPVDIYVGGRDRANLFLDGLLLPNDSGDPDQTPKVEGHR